MSFVNEYISKEDRERFNLASVDERIPFSNPQRSWAIDRERNVFLRKIAVGMGSEPESRYEKTFHLYWEGRNLIVGVTSIDRQKYMELPGEFFHYVDIDKKPDIRFYIGYLTHIGDLSTESGKIVPEERDQVLSTLQEALTHGCGGVFVHASPESLSEPHQAIIKISPTAGV